MFWLSFVSPQVPSRLSLVYWRIWRFCSWRVTYLPVFQILFFNIGEWALFFQSYRATYWLYVLNVFCIPQVPFRLSWAYWRICGGCVYPGTNLVVLHHLPLCLSWTYGMKRLACFPYALSYRSDKDDLCVVFFWLYFVSPDRIPAELGRLKNLWELCLSENQLTGTTSPSFFLLDIWMMRLAFYIPYPTSRIGWLGFYMFWPSFVYSRSHSGWAGPIGEFIGAEFTR